MWQLVTNALNRILHGRIDLIVYCAVFCEAASHEKPRYRYLCSFNAEVSSYESLQLGNIVSQGILPDRTG